MTDEASRGGETDNAITVLAVSGVLLLVGHVAALLPEGWAKGWISATAFTLLVFLYAMLAPTGRRSGIIAFLFGGFLVLPIYLSLLSMASQLGPGSWYVAAFADFQVGWSSRGWGHAGIVYLPLWIGSLELLILLALVLRALILRARG